MPQIASNLTVDSQNTLDGPVTGNGKYHVFQSATISTTNNKAVDATFAIHEFLPNRQGLGKAEAMFILERQDDAGNWFPVHTLYNSVRAIEFDDTENGGIIPVQQLSYGPQIFNFDGPVAVDATDGRNIILQDHQKRGVLPDKVRFCVVIHERDFGNIGAFDSITFSIDYELRAE